MNVNAIRIGENTRISIQSESEKIHEYQCYQNKRKIHESQCYKNKRKYMNDNAIRIRKNT